MRRQNNVNIKAGQTYRLGSGTGHDPVRNVVIDHVDIMHGGKLFAQVHNMITGKVTMVQMQRLRTQAICLNPTEGNGPAAATA